MLDLDRTMFFKAKFDVVEKSGGDALWAVITSLRNWSIRKAKRDNYDIPSDLSAWTDLKHGSRIDSSKASVELFSCIHREDNAYTWACRHSENVSISGCAPRRWTTEIGFEGKTFDSGTVSIITMYSDLPGFLGPLQDVPRPSIPTLVRLIAENNKLACTVDGRPLELDAVEVTYDNVEEIYRTIADETRELPIIVCSPSVDGDLSLDPITIAKQLGPNALVLFSRECEVMDALNGAFPVNGLKCYGGAVRIYASMPRFEKQADSYRHRYFSRFQINENGEEHYYKILRRALAEDVHFWETSVRVDDVKRLNRKSMYEKRAQAEWKAFQEKTIDDAETMILEAEERAKEAEAAFDEAAEELKRCKKRLNEAENKVNAYEHALALRGAGELVQTLDEISELDLTEIAHLFVKAYPERLDFSVRGWKSLRECVTAPELFWYALHSMCTILYPLYLENGAGIVQEFNSRTRLTLTLRESETTEKNAKLMCQREDVYQNRPLIITPHIKSGNGDPNSPRFVHIYFNRDEVTGRLVIGDTKHLDVSSTPKR